MIYTLFVLALAFVPFTSIQGLPFLGELQHVLSAYIYFAAFGLSVLPVMAHFRSGRSPSSPEKIYALPTFALLFFGAIALSFAVNFPTIKDSMFLGRSGLEKFFSSTILVGYGFLVAILTYFISGRHEWDKLIIKPLAISVVVCAIFSVFEMAGRVSGGMSSLFHMLSAPVYGDFDVLEWDTRLRSVAFEPPDFANSAGYIWPWLLAAMLYTKGNARLGFSAIWMVLNIMIYFTGARTSLVVMSGLIAVFVVLWFVFLPKHGRGDPEKMIAPITLVFIMAVPALIAGFFFYFDQIVYYVVAGDNVSNLSRLASMTAAFRMFQDSPILGHGFGQFGFHISEYMPGWGFYSYEVKDWLSGKGGFWPAVYSFYARLGADMGIVGLGVWIGIWLWLAHEVLVETMRYRQRTGIIPFAAVPLILSCFCVLLAGIPSDSVRSPMIWVNMGLACRYLVTLRASCKKPAMPLPQ